ncbi:MAG TPA: AmmeMemoRadiSam system radical SAM enzyme [Sedimentisphaerales bacterium]|nr:AmmeMemoRadiSam system radical SAM enzyme [Sedimentisphaerales bacterium]
MREEDASQPGLSKRELLKAGLCGVCAMGLARIGGLGKAYGQTAEKGFMRPRQARWMTRTGNSRVRCELCPWRCELEPGQRARCRVRTNRNGTGYTLAYGNPALVQEDPVERKPFFHVLPGSRSLSISTAGCNMACKFCEVWDIALVNPEEVHAYDMPPSRIIEHVRAANLRLISYAFGEPVIFYEYMMDVAALAKEQGIINLMHTGGYIQPEPLKELSRVIDAANIDLKGFDPAFYRDFCGAEQAPVLESLKLLKKAGVHIEVTNIVIPTLNDDMKIIRQMCTWIKNELGADVPLHFARFYPLYKLTNLPPTPVSTLDNARDTALDVGLEFVYVARVTGHKGEDTFCPGCGKVVIERVGFVIDHIHLNDGKCNHCGRTVAGRWK